MILVFTGSSLIVDQCPVCDSWKILQFAELRYKPLWRASGRRMGLGCPTSLDERS